MESCEGVGTHNRSCPDLKHLTMLGTLSPDLNVARVPSQKIGRELEGSSTGPMCKREPERSEGSGGKAPRAFQLLLVLT
jgi:hypothetical protein